MGSQSQLEFPQWGMFAVLSQLRSYARWAWHLGSYINLPVRVCLIVRGPFKIKAVSVVCCYLMACDFYISLSVPVSVRLSVTE